MDKSLLPKPPVGLSWKEGPPGQMFLYGRYQLPNGRKVERTTMTTSVYVARRRYCQMQRQIAEAWAAGKLEELLKPRATRSDKGKKRGPMAARKKRAKTSSNE